MTTGHALGPIGDGAAAACALLDDAAVYAAGLRYEDLVRAADVVVTKPGYGIIAECLANDAAILYTDRGHFAEYDVLVEAMPRVRAMPVHPPRRPVRGPVAGSPRRPDRPACAPGEASAPTAPPSPPAISSLLPDGTWSQLQAHPKDAPRRRDGARGHAQSEPSPGTSGRGGAR